MNENLNKEFYNAKVILEHYDKMVTIGLFDYEKFLINKFITRDHNVLDIGCGAGRVTLALQKMNYNVMGIDYSIKMIEIAKKKKINVIVDDVTNLSFGDNIFDSCIFSFNGLMLIETYEGRKKALSEISRVLKKHGILVFTTPFLDDKIKTKYWSEKIRSFGISVDEMNFEQKLCLSDEVLDEEGLDFYIHIPLLEEVHTLLKDVGFVILEKGIRLEEFGEERYEKLLDNNYYWVVSNEKN